jgi:hypothetical protein
MSESSESTFSAPPEPSAEVTFTDGVTIQVSKEALGDLWDTRRVIDYAYRLWLEPWLAPDRIQWPTFTPLPRLAAAQRTLVEKRQRIRDAWSVLRGWDRLYSEDDYR